MSKYSRVLVTGGAGFIGSHIVDQLLDNGLEVTILDDLSSGRIANIAHHQGEPRCHFVKGDIRDVNLLETVMENVDAVFHEAALTSVPASEKNPILTNDVNVTGTLNLLKTSLDAGVKRFIYASSAAVYGETDALPIRESDRPTPTSPYGVSKLAAEKYLEVFHSLYGLETVCLRYFNVYGPRQADTQYSGVITQLTHQLIHNRPPTIYGDGDQTRDFVNVKDIVDANTRSLERPNVPGETFNIATGQATTINQLVTTLQQITGKDHLRPVYEDPRPGDIRYSYADIQKAGAALDYHPKVTLLNGLSEFVEWQSGFANKLRNMK